MRVSYAIAGVGLIAIIVVFVLYVGGAFDMPMELDAEDALSVDEARQRILEDARARAGSSRVTGDAAVRDQWGVADYYGADLTPLVPEPERIYSPEEIIALRDEMVPLIEAMTGWKFKEPPGMGMVDRLNLAKTLAADYQAHATQYEEHLNMQIGAYATHRGLSHALVSVGTYQIEDRMIIFCPDQIGPVYALAGVDRARFDAVTRSVIAHFLIVKLIDEQVDFNGALDFALGMEPARAVRAAVYGYACFVQDRIGEQLGLDELSKTTARRIAAGALTIPDPAAAAFNAAVSETFEMVYERGEAFVRYHFDEGGHERLHEIMHNLPYNPAMVDRPSTYDGLGQTRKSRFAQLGRFFAAQFDSIKGLEDESNDERRLQAYVGPLGPTRADFNWFLPSSRRDKTGRRWTLATSFLLENDSGLDILFRELNEMERRRTVRSSRSDRISIENLSFEPLADHLTNAEVATKVVFDRAFDDKTDRFVIYRAGRGRMLFNLVLHNVEAEEQWVLEAFQKTLNRHAELMNGDTAAGQVPGGSD